MNTRITLSTPFGKVVRKPIRLGRNVRLRLAGDDEAPILVARTYDSAGWVAFEVRVGRVAYDDDARRYGALLRRGFDLSPELERAAERLAAEWADGRDVV